jgi:uncharacterized protein (TIGR02117 family)
MLRLFFFFLLAHLTFPASCVSAEENLTPVDYFLIIVNHGYHSGIVFQKKHLEICEFPEIETFSKYNFVEIGWGEESFYRAGNPGFFGVLSAVTMPGGSVLHIVGFNPKPNEYFQNSSLTYLPISTTGMKTLCTFISNEVERNANTTTDLGPGLYGFSRFYRGKSSYSIIENCNHWTALALAKAGCQESASYVITSADAESFADKCRKQSK